MENLRDDVFMKFLPNTLVAVRKEFSLDKPDVLKKYLDDLEQWVSMQKHFVKKNFSREDLERILINCKGSLEKAKLKLDKSCTNKTLLPEYFDKLDARADLEPYDNLITCTLLPQLTENHERIAIIRNSNYTGTAGFIDCYRYFIKVLEYIKKNDYNLGLIVILDYTNLNLKNLFPKLNILQMRQIASIIFESYGLRLKKLYILSPSKMIVKIMKQILVSKLGKCIQVNKDYKKLYKDLPIEILPEEYEGPEKCIDDLQEDFLRALTSENFVNYLKEMKSACTNESLRDSSVFNEAYLGAPGSLNK